PDFRLRYVEHEPRLRTEGQLAPALVKEWIADETLGLAPARVPMVRLSGEGRLELDVSVTEANTITAEPSGFRHGGTYLLAGALGPAGVQLCEELARHYRPVLILLSRRPREEANAAVAA